MLGPMLIADTVASLRAAALPRPLALVPTMGALHEGHASLVRAAKRRAASVVVSIFVNPTQFGDPRDLERYPRPIEADIALLEAEGADALFLPSVAEIYPEGDETIVETTRLAGLFHGAVRPGHFRGVATVVCKLLNIAEPDVALFGEKDYQQLAVIRRMVRDLHMRPEIVGVPTLRAADGLALSSRNVRLSPEDRAAAPVLHRALTAAKGSGTVEAALDAVRAVIATEPRARLKGLDAVEADSFAQASGPIRGRVGLMLSAEFGPPDNPVLLIDQMELP